jgi:hypothetical protein
MPPVTANEASVCVGALVGACTSFGLYEVSRRIEKERRERIVKRVRALGVLFVGAVVLVDVLSDPGRFALLGLLGGFITTTVGLMALHRVLGREPLG